MQDGEWCVFPSGGNGEFSARGTALASENPPVAEWRVNLGRYRAAKGQASDGGCLWCRRGRRLCGDGNSAASRTWKSKLLLAPAAALVDGGIDIKTMISGL